MGRALLYDKVGYEVVPKGWSLNTLLFGLQAFGYIRQSDSPRIIGTDSEQKPVASRLML